VQAAEGFSAYAQLIRNMVIIGPALDDTWGLIGFQERLEPVIAAFHRHNLLVCNGGDVIAGLQRKAGDPWHSTASVANIFTINRLTECACKVRFFLESVGNTILYDLSVDLRAERIAGTYYGPPDAKAIKEKATAEYRRMVKRERECLQLSMSMNVVPSDEAEQQEIIESLCRHMGCKPWKTGDYGRTRPWSIEMENIYSDVSVQEWCLPWPKGRYIESQRYPPGWVFGIVIAIKLISNFGEKSMLADRVSFRGLTIQSGLDSCYSRRQPIRLCRSRSSSTTRARHRCYHHTIGRGQPFALRFRQFF
jgi:hypothetical protein